MNVLGINITNNTISYAILNEDEDIISSGIRLFNKIEADDNIERRIKRSNRRLLRRRNFRLLRLKKVLIKYKIIENFNFYSQNENPYFLRKKGLKEQLTDEELAKALYHLIKHRGVLDFNIEEDDEEGTKGILKANETKLANKYICEVQLENLLTNGIIRGKNNIFKTKDYLIEALALLNNQKKFNEKINDQFIEKIEELICTRRTYYQGAGKQSPYSWKDEEEWLNKLIGHCTYFPEELRMLKHSYTAELFNLLNDLNNLKVNGENLTKEQKKELIEIFKKQKSVSIKKIAKSLGVSEDNIKGYRIDIKGKPLFTSLETYIDITNIFPTDNRDLIDNIASICTYYQDKESRLKKLKILLKEYNINDDDLDKLSEKKYSGTHSLSKKLMNILIPEMIEENKNSMQLIEEKKLVPFNLNFKEMEQIPTSYIDNLILNPAVKKSCKQVIIILNELLKKYKIDKIVFKSLNNENTLEEKGKIIKAYSKNKDLNDEIKEIIDKYNLDNKYFMLLKLWKSQEYKCMYSGDKVELNDIIENPELFEVGHILPLSISLDFSQNNSVFVKKSENNKKGTKTCYEYFTSVLSKRKFEDFKSQVEELYKSQRISKSKKDKLLIEESINKYSFNNLNRILNNSSYVMKSLIELLTNYFKDKNLKIKIETVNTNLFNVIKRKNKIINNNIYYKEKIGDSILLIKINKIMKSIRYLNFDNSNMIYFIKTGELLSDIEFLDLFKFNNFNREINNIKINLSSENDKKVNRQLSNETIYSTRKIENIDYQVQKIELYDRISKKIDNLFSNTESYSKLLIFRDDRKTFDKMLDIFLTYKKEATKGENPFYLYYKKNGYITTARENGAVPIKKLKVLGDPVKTAFDLSHKYKNTRKKIIVTKLPSFRLDIYKKKDDNKYKILVIRYIDLKELKAGYVIEKEKYEELKKKKGIDETYQFIFSLYKGNKFKINNEKKYIYYGINDELKNKFQVQSIDKNYSNYITEIADLKLNLKNNKSLRNKIFDICNIEFNSEEEARKYIKEQPTSSKQQIIYLNENKINSLKKIHTNLLGKEYESANNEKLKLYFPKQIDKK